MYVWDHCPAATNVIIYFLYIYIIHHPREEGYWSCLPMTPSFCSVPTPQPHPSSPNAAPIHTSHSPLLPTSYLFTLLNPPRFSVLNSSQSPLPHFEYIYIIHDLREEGYWSWLPLAPSPPFSSHLVPLSSLLALHHPVVTWNNRCIIVCRNEQVVSPFQYAHPLL